MITELEIRKIFHDPTEIITRAVQPALWLLIFGHIMPGWLKVLAHVNPLTYMVDALRTMMTGTPSTFNLPFYFGILFVASTILVIIMGSIYSRVIT